MVLIGHRASGIGHRASGIGHRASGIGHRACNLLKQKYLYQHSNKSISNFLQLFKPLSSLDNLLSYSFQHFLKLKLLIIFLYPIILPCAYGLSSFTVNVIHGFSPKVDNVKLAADKHGFTVNGVFYSESTGNIKEDEIKEFDGNLTFNHFVVKLFSYQSLDNRKNYQDVDGDNIDPVQPFLMTVTSSQWFDANGVKIPDGDKNKIIGCGSGYPMPLRLEISNQVQTISQYGIPRKSNFVTLKKAYKIAAKPELCYVKPNSSVIEPDSQWFSVDNNGKYIGWNGKITNRHYLAGGGYSKDFVPNMGFKVNPTASNGKKFPTTGFPGAKFQLLMSGAQRDYSYSIVANPGNNVSIDAMGFVTLNGKPTGDGKVTIRAKLIRNTAVQFDYSFNPNSVWANPQGDFKGTLEQASNRCGQLSNLLTRKELTNSPYNNLSVTIGSEEQNVYTRAIDGTVLGEWGYVTEKTYPQSAWRWLNSIPYWTKDIQNDEQVFDVYPNSGHVGISNVKVKPWINYVVCRG